MKKVYIVAEILNRYGDIRKIFAVFNDKQNAEALAKAYNSPNIERYRVLPWIVE